MDLLLSYLLLSRNILRGYIESQPISNFALIASPEILPGMALSNDSAQSPDSFDRQRGDVIGDQKNDFVAGYINPR